eukprot:TRINITY_DN2509_c0_g1_i2.p1 TRINITY_DN2509_c0_g1~~TRINITY_DN2509_c0_g1_i2.p1  ORF type:complete len:928 (-),score=285.96 TRINITY_DN2509_c0_g1_i2:70-2805(-)
MEDFTPGKGTMVFRRKAWMNSFTLYRSLVEYLITNTTFINTLSDVIDSAEADHFAKIIVSLYNTCGKALPLIKSMIFNEFSKVTAEGEGSLLRGNSMVSKVEGVYVRLVGSNYLKYAIGDILTRIATDASLNFEVDPRKAASSLSNDDSDMSLASSMSLSLYDQPSRMMVTDMGAFQETNRKQLVYYAQLLLDRITDPEVIAAMPRDIRAIAGYTAIAAHKHAPANVAPLVGGFIMLRYFTPAITCPEASNVLAADTAPTIRSKRNFVLLGKLLQNTSNNVLFGVKEDYMSSLNSFITGNKEKMLTYLTQVAADPLADASTPAWQDTDGGASVAKRSGLSTSTSSFSSSFSSSSSSPSHSPSPPSFPPTTTPGGPVPRANLIGHRGAPSPPPTSPVLEMPTPLHTATGILIGHRGQSAPTSPLVSSHSISASPSTTSLSSLASSSSDTIDIRSFDLQDLFELHRILDQSSDKLVQKMRGSPVTTDEILVILKDLGPSPKTKRTRKQPAAGEEEPVVSEPISGGVAEDMVQQLERARFLYQGPNDKEGKPVFYLIMNRIRVEFLDNVNPLVSHIFRVMDSAVNQGYNLVVDMSWASVSTELKRSVYTHLPKMARIFSRKYKKNVLGIYIVHPSAYTRAVVHFMRFFTSRKLKNKIYEVYNWKELTKTIDTDSIMLPESSKDYITKSYNVVKVNAKGKRQDRLVKFTSNSVLNIDPKTRRIQNEKRIEEIEEIACKHGSPDIFMRFKVTPDELAQKSKSLFGGSHADLEFRRYVCNNEQERDSILQDIFENAFKLNFVKARQEYRVVKVNQAGKHQERIFKLTCDSLLNLADTKIQSETSFAGIEGVTLDPHDADVLWMKLKAEPFRRKIICRGYAPQLFEVLSEAMLRYQQGNAYLERELNQDADELFGMKA